MSARVHSAEFRTRRFWNWFPMGLTYALLYMGRYNLNVAANHLPTLISKQQFGTIFGIGAVVYGLSPLLINGVLTDKLGGRRAILIAAAGAGAANLALMMYVRSVLGMPDPSAASVMLVMSLLYSVNMYFQSFGAVAIVKVNAQWFHVRERGGFSGIFGIMISSGIFLAFDVSERLLAWVPDQPWVVFQVPGLGLLVMLLIETFLLKDSPKQAGFENFDLEDASSGEDDTPLSSNELLKRILKNKVILTIALIEFCTGVLRQGVMQSFRFYAGEQAKGDPGDAGWPFAIQHWGLILMVAGIIGGNVAGWVSDKVFGSRRAPAAAGMYGLLIVCCLAMPITLGWSWGLLVCAFLMSLAVIGTHGLLSGTATMDFGGRKAAGTAVGLIDGCVYFGTALQSIALGYLTTQSWSYWPWFLLPFAIIGILLCLRIWHARPTPKSEPTPAPAPLEANPFEPAGTSTGS